MEFWNELRPATLEEWKRLLKLMRESEPAPESEPEREQEQDKKEDDHGDR